MAENDTEQDLARLEAALKQLEAEYNMFFAGRLRTPPWETRRRVEALVKQYDRAYIKNYGDRFRFQTLQSRYAKFINLWDRGLRAREEGSPGPFAQKRDRVTEQLPENVRHVAAFRDPLREMDKLHDLYNSLAEARREAGQDAWPFHKFAELVKGQVQKLQADGSAEVAFRVSVKDGKVSFTAKAVKKGSK